MFEGREHVNSMPGKDLSNRDIVRRLSMSEVGKLSKDDLQRALKSMITSEPEPNQPDSALTEQLSHLTLVPTHIKEVKDELSELRKGIEFVMKQAEQMVKENEAKSKIIQELQQGLIRANQRNETMSRDIKLLQERQNEHENYTSRYNLLIDGMDEKPNENLTDIFAQLLQNNLQITDDIKFDVIHRLGRPAEDRKRTVIVRFMSQEDGMLVWNKRRLLTGTRLYLNEDFSQETKMKRATLAPIMKEARAQNMRATLVGGSLLINGHSYTVDNLDKLPASIEPAKAASIVTENCVAFFGRLSPLSNFQASQIKVEGITFSCAEPYYVYQKAIHCMDDVTAARVLRTSEPAAIKRIGDNIGIPPNSGWNNEKREIMKKACREQNPHLCKCLTDTGNKQIVEASVDRLWGAGAKLHSDEIKNKTWRGLKGNIPRISSYTWPFAKNTG